LNYWLDTIQWQPDIGDGARYYHPAMVFDLRNLADCGTPGLTLGKFVLCAGAVLPAGVMEIGETGFALTPGRRAGLEAWVGESIVAPDVTTFIQELIFNLGDPACVARWRPVRVSGRTLRLDVGDIRVRRRVLVTDPEFRQTLAVERLNYQAWKAQESAGLLPVGHHLRCLDYQREHYGVDYHEFLKIDDVRSMPDEGLLPHRTTLTDSFTDTDATALTSHTGESGTWSQLTGADATTIQSNKASNTSSADTLRSWHRLDADLSSGNHYAQGVFTSSVDGNSSIGVNTRYASAANTSMAAIWVWWAPESVNKLVTGTLTSLATGTDNAASGDTLKLTSDSADLHQSARNGTDMVSVTDSAIASTNLRAGFSLRPRNAAVVHTCDTFEAADLAAAGVVGPLLGGRLVKHGILQGRLVGAR
jgi:hypothetical protein